MNSTPKEQDGDDSVAAAHGSRPSLDQTVLGVAPPASSREAEAPAPAELPPGVAPAATLAGLALVAAPTIAVSDGTGPAPTPPTSDPALAGDSSEPVAPVEVGATLPLQVPAPIAAPPRPAPPLMAPREEAQQHTELSSDYLRAARDAALSQVALSAAPSAPRVDPVPLLTPPAPMAARAAGEAGRRRAPLASDAMDSPGSGTRPSIAPPYAVPSPISSERQSNAGSAGVRGFEPVPVLRAPLAESLSGALGPIAELGGGRNLLAPPSRPRPPVSRAREASGRWLLLCSVALATVGVVSLGERLLSRYRTSRARAVAVGEATSPSGREAAPTLEPSTGPASRALLANRPAPEPDARSGQLRVVSATAGQRGDSEASTGSASPESQLAATAGRHVLSGNYAEALPVYQQLQRKYPEQTAYAVMARLLGEKLAAAHDTRTVTPTTAPPRGARAR